MAKAVWTSCVTLFLWRDTSGGLGLYVGKEGYWGLYFCSKKLHCSIYLNFFPRGPKTTNNYNILHIVVSFYPMYMSSRLGRIEGFGQHSFPPYESLRDVYIHKKEPNKAKHPFLVSKTCSWNPNAQSSGFLSLPPCGLNLQTQISCYNHFLTNHMEHRLKKWTV